MNWNNIPAELTELRQWACAEGKVPIDPRTKLAASPTDPSTWVSFQEAIRAGYPRIGFMLHAADPYTIIDIDSPDTDHEHQLANSVFTQFQSYCERSVSGKGFHIVIKGSVPQGRRRDNVEIYSSQRFMLFTGDIINGHNVIQDLQPKLELLFNEMGGGKADQIALKEDAPEILSDQELFNRAYYADNGDKFDALCRGDMTGYASQSEADLALISILAFYTENNEQVRRLFRMSNLGKREKAVRNNKYLDFTIGRVRNNQPSQTNINIAVPPKAPELPPVEKPARPEYIKTTQNVEFPPGFVGDLAKYIYDQSPYPSKEIATTAALTFASGISARQFNVSGTGLNLYLFLLARSGFGKEAAKDGIDQLISGVASSGVPGVMEFKGAGKYSSAPAIAKALAKFPCKFSIFGEGGVYLRELSKAKEDSANSTVYRMLLDIFTKSGYGKMIDGQAYSDSAKDIPMVHAPALTLLWESTQDAYDRAVTLQTIEQGLLTRFVVLEVDHDLPEYNQHSREAPPQWLVDRTARMVSTVLNMTAANEFRNVAFTKTASDYLAKVREEADNRRRKKDALPEWENALISRIYVKCIKVAGVLACWDNPAAPEITLEHAMWANGIVSGDVINASGKIKSGSFGDDDVPRLTKAMLRMIHRMRVGSTQTRSDAKFPQYIMDRRDLIPNCAFSQIGHITLKSVPPHFRERLVQEAIATLVDQEVITPLPPQTVKEMGGRGAKIYSLATNIDEIIRKS